MKKAYLIALTMALLCVPSMQAFADEDDVPNRDMDEFSYESWEDAWGYFDGYTNAPLNGQNTAPCPYEPELADYQSPVRLLHVGPYSGVSVKNAPQEDGAEIGYMYSDEVMRLVDDSDEAWYKVTYDGQEGYVSKEDSVKVEETYKMPAGTSENRATAVNYAMGFLGGKYGFGKCSREEGYDCSALVRTVLQDSAKISIGYSSKEQAKQGTPIDITEVKPGDLLFYGTSEETINHVAMYIGNGKIIQAQSTGHGITIKPWSEPANFFRAVRVFPE